ncbi:MAG: two-component system response regulator [Phycisphaerales bacterium]|nr:MAG: two-component system response regulator [Phycisphaerales bacterium]
MSTEPGRTADAAADEPITGHVLVVDDNAQNAELLEAYLDDLPVRVSVAHDGQSALRAVQDDPPDLILMDIMMPRMSGYQATERLKEDPATRDIPIIMVTALGEVGDVERAVECGADDFLTKPVHKVELLTRVRSLLRVRQLQRELDQAQSQLRRLLREE